MGADAAPPTLWRRLTEPSPLVTEPDARRRARLLLSLLVPLIALALPAALLGPLFGAGPANPLLSPPALAGLASCALLVAGYALGRTTRHDAAAIYVVGVTAVGAWGAYLAAFGTLEAPSTLAFLGLSIVLASLLLSLRATLAIGSAHVLGILLIPALRPDVPVGPLIPPLLGTAMVTMLLGLSSSVRHADARERRATQAALRASEERHRALVERSPDGIVILSEGRFVYANPSALRIMGARSAEDLYGRLATSLLEPSVRPIVEARIQRIRGGASTEPLEVRLHRLDGRTVHVELMGAPATHDGKPADQTILRDITSRKEAEEAARVARDQRAEIERLQEISSVKTQLLNTASHELNTPIAALRLQLHLLKATEADDDPRRRRALELLDRNVERLSVLVKDVLDVARMQSGQLRMRPGPTDLADLAREAVELYAEPARAGGVALVLDAPDRMPMLADGQRVAQVLVNLLSNALKFTPAGGRVEVSVRAEGAEAVVSVSDSGSGLTPEQMARLFQPFSQVHDTMQAPRGGTGLGLHICRGIVQQHEGRIWAESAGPGRGSTFRFALPLKAPGETATAPPAA